VKLPRTAFGLKIGLEAIDSELATNTGLLEAAEWSESLMLTAVNGHIARRRRAATERARLKFAD
jgi:hypothetical protein